MFYLAQLLMIAFAYFTGRKEAIYLSVVRTLPPGNNIEKPYHKWGWLAAVVVGIACALLQSDLKARILALLLCGVWYWTVYEAAYNKPVFGNWKHVGTTAATDKFLRRLFGRNVETWVVLLKVAGILILNLLNLFL